MEWFIYAVKNTFNYQGRARRAEFGWFYLSNFLIQSGAMLIFWGWIVVLSFSGSLNAGGQAYSALGEISVIIALGAFFIFQIITWLAGISLTTRRLHDLGWSGWWQLLFYVLPFFTTLLPLWGVLKKGVSLESEQTAFITMVGIIMLYCLAILVITGLLFFKDGRRGANKYGEDPKEEEFIAYARKSRERERKESSPLIVSK